MSSVGVMINTVKKPAIDPAINSFDPWLISQPAIASAAIELLEKATKVMGIVPAAKRVTPL